MIKLYNSSGITDFTLLPVLQAAKRAVCCPGNVIVKVTKGGYRVQSKAVKCHWVAKFALSKRHYTKASNGTLLKGGHVNTDGGFIILRPHWAKDPLDMAEGIFETALHEFVHVKEFQERGKLFAGYNRPWRFRPHERRAVQATEEAKKKVKYNFDDVILNLAIEIEQLRKRKQDAKS